MIEENQFGYRDKRGHFVPKEAADRNPLWVLPLNIKKIFKEEKKNQIIKIYIKYREYKLRYR